MWLKEQDSYSMTEKLNLNIKVKEWIIKIEKKEEGQQAMGKESLKLDQR